MKDREHCLVTDPTNTSEIISSMKLLLEDNIVNQRILSNGYEFARKVNESYLEEVGKIEDFFEETLRKSKL